MYAYCRWADDLADEAGGGQRALDLLAWWRQELLHCYDGVPLHPVLVALQQTIRRFRIPADPFLDLLVAFEQDQPHQTVSDLRAIARLLSQLGQSSRSAGALPFVILSDAVNASYSDSICTGLQLANFWQDVSRDLDIGRVYLPEEDCRQFGYGPSDLEARRFTPAFAALLRFEVERARACLQGGLPLVKCMPIEVQADIELFIRGGLAILRKVEAWGYNVWQQRPALSQWDKLSLVGGVFLGRLKALCQ